MSVKLRFNSQRELEIYESGRWQVLSENSIDDDKAIVLIPSETVLSMEYEVPGRNKSDWMTALPYAVEELLSEPVDSLYFIPLERNKDNIVTFWAISKELLNDYATRLSKLQVKSVYLIPDFLSIPVFSDADVHFCKTGADRTVYRNSLYLGGASSSNLFITMSSRLSEKSFKEVGDIELEIDGVNLEKVNLLSALDNNSVSVKHFKNLRLAAVALLFPLAGYLWSVYAVSQAHFLASESYKSSSERMFKERFPNINKIVDIKLQGETLFSMEEDRDAVSLANVVSDVQSVMDALKLNITVKSLSWVQEKKRVTISIEAKSALDLTRFKEGFDSRFKVELNVKQAINGKVKGVIHVSA